jgi:DNA-binding transcriptional regulator YiaG
MAKIEPVLKSEIQRLAKREIRSTFLPLRREVRAMRLKLSGLSKNFSVLDRFTKEQVKQVEKKGVKLEASLEEVKASRLSPDRIRSLRKKLGVSQRKFAILIGVSNNAVFLWERGKSKPGGEKKAALVALGKLRKWEVRKLLAQKIGTKVKTKGKRPGAKTRRKRPGKRVIRRKK